MKANVTLAESNIGRHRHVFANASQSTRAKDIFCCFQPQPPHSEIRIISEKRKKCNIFKRVKVMALCSFVNISPWRNIKMNEQVAPSSK